MTFSIILFTDEKTFTLTTPKKPQNDRLHTHIHQPRRRRHRTPARAINVQSLMTSVGE